MYGLIQRSAYSHDSRIQIKSFSQNQNAFLKDVNNRLFIKVRNLFFQSMAEMYDRLFTTRIKMIVQNFPRFAQIRIQHFYYYTCKNQDKYLMKTYQNTRKIVFICDVFVFGDLSCPHQHSYTKTHIKGHLITPKTFWPHTFFIFTNSFMNYISARSFFTSSKLTRFQITVSDYEKKIQSRND